MTKKVEKYPEADGKEYLHKGLKGGLSVVPIFGGAVSEAFDAGIQSPLQKRITDWGNEIVEAITELQDQFDEFNIENLKDNEVFFDTLLYAWQIALRNHQEEKREALKGAILNTALNTNPEEAIQNVFMYYIDRFTPLHLRLLKFFHDPKKWAELNGIEYPSSWAQTPPANVLEFTIHELKGKKELYDQFLTDLANHGLIDFDILWLHTTMNTSYIFKSRTTKLGKQFIKFITAPKVE